MQPIPGLTAAQASYDAQTPPDNTRYDDAAEDLAAKLNSLNVCHGLNGARLEDFDVDRDRVLTGFVKVTLCAEEVAGVEIDLAGLLRAMADEVQGSFE